MPQMKDITPLGVFRHYSISQYWAVSDATTAEHAPNMHLITPQCTSTLRHIKEALWELPMHFTGCIHTLFTRLMFPNIGEYWGHVTPYYASS